MGRGLVLDEELGIVAKLGGTRAGPFVVNLCDAVGVEVGGGEVEDGCAVGEEGALVDGSHADGDFRREIDSDDRGAHEPCAVFVARDDLGIAGVFNASDIEVVHGAQGEDGGWCAGEIGGEAGDDVAVYGLR